MGGLQKLEVLNEIVHTLIRSDNFMQAMEFYFSTLEDIEVAETSWNDKNYWDRKTTLFRSLSRPESSAPKENDREKQHGGSYVRTDSICRKWNEQRCEEPSPHIVNGTKLFHICLYCFKKDPVVIDDHQADLCPRKPQGQRGNRGLGSRGSRGGGYRN